VKKVAGGKPRKPHPDSGVIAVPVLIDRVKEISKYLKRSKVNDDWVDVVTSLSRESLEAMFDAMMKGDGCYNWKSTSFACQLNGVSETFEVLATLLGYRIVKNNRGFNLSKNKNRYLKISSGKVSKKYYTGRVWCPNTKNGTWVMKQDKLITINSNTWMRKNLELQLTEMAHHPGRYATLFKGARAIQNRVPEGVTQEDLDAMPNWMREDFGSALGIEDGELKYMTGTGLPLEQLNDVFSVKGMASMLNPLIKVPVEIITGKNIFKDKELLEDTSGYEFRNAPEWFKSAMDYREIKGKEGQSYITVNPIKKYVLQSLPMTGRSVPTIMKIFNVSKGEAESILPILTGLRVYRRNVETEKYLREQEQMTQLWSQLQQMGIAKEFVKPYVPSETRKQLTTQPQETDFNTKMRQFLGGNQ